MVAQIANISHGCSTRVRPWRSADPELVTERREGHLLLVADPHGADPEEPALLRRLRCRLGDLDQPVLERTRLLGGRLLVEHLEVKPKLMDELRGLGRALLRLGQLELLLRVLTVLDLRDDSLDQP